MPGFRMPRTPWQRLKGRLIFPPAFVYYEQRRKTKPNSDMRDHLARSVLRQLWGLRNTLIIIYIPSVCVLGLAVLVCRYSGMDLHYLFRDPASTLDSPVYVGIISNIGILLWSACASICFFSWMSLAGPLRDRETSRFLLAAAILTSVLCLDDLFMFHDRIFPNYLHVTERAVLFALVFAFVSFFVYFWSSIRKTDFVLLFLSMGFFSASAVLDHLIPFVERFLPLWSQNILFEDGSKLLGIVTWLAYFARISQKQLRSRMGNQRG